MIRVRLPDLRGVVERLRVASRPTPEDSAVVANEACTLIYYRTVRDGKDKFGKEFPPYSTTPIYIGGDLLAKAIAAGGRNDYLKEGKGASPGGKRFIRYSGNAETGRIRESRERRGFKGQSRTSKMRTAYFAGGYAKFKAGLQGVGDANSGVVNLSVTGTLMGSMTFTEGVSDAAFGVASADERGFRLAFTRAEMAPIADGLIQRGRDFWGVAILPEEKAHLEKILAERLRPRVRAAVREGLRGA